MATNTTNNYFSKPAVGGDTDSWGTTLNANWDAVDSIVTGGTSITRLGIGTTNTTLPLICNAASATAIAASFSGLVGIGTSSPDRTLHLYGGDLKIESGAPRIYLTDVNHNSDYSILNDNGLFGIYDDTNTAYRLRIDSSGKVGIGTSSPDRLLDITDDTNDGTGGLVIHSYLPTLELDDISGSGTNFILQHDATNTLFKHGTTERMRIAANGNVGIGTTSPAYNLDIEANTAQARIHSTAGNSVLRLDSVDDGESKIFFADNSASAIGTIEYHHDSNYMSFDTVATERMRIDSSGRVGIGTTSPDSILEVVGADPILTIRDASTSGASSHATLRLAETGVSDSLNLHYDISLDEGHLTFNYDNTGSNATERMRITSSGNVGIGTSSPAQALHVVGKIRLESNFPTIEFADTDNNPDFTVTGGNGRVAFYDETNSAYRLVVNSSGNVGIGTDSPQKKLHVKDGDIRIESTYPRLYLTDTDHNSDYSIINSNGSFLIYDDTNASNRMVIANTSGNVGIGTASPSSKLHVAGGATFDGGTSTIVDVMCDNSGNAELRLMGSTQGTGRLYVGQSLTYGGGIEYNGDSDPVTSNGGSDNIVLYRRNNGVSEWTARNSHGDNNWEFRGTVTAAGAVINGDLVIPSKIIHAGDTDTYTQFHNANQWRVVTAGVETLEVNTSAVTTSTRFVGAGAIAYTDFSFVSDTDGDQTVLFSLPSGHAVINALITTTTFNHNEIEKLTNSSCVVNRLDSVSGTPTVNLRVWHTKL